TLPFNIKSLFGEIVSPKNSQVKLKGQIKMIHIQGDLTTLKYDKKEDKKADEKKRDMSKVKCYNCKKEGHFAKDCKKANVKDYNYYKTKMLLAKKDSDEQVHTEGQRSYWQIIRLGGSSACYQFFVDLLKQLDKEDLNQLWALVKEYLSIRPATNDKEMELWVELKRMYEPDPEDQLRSIKFREGLLGIKCTRHSHCQIDRLARSLLIQGLPNDIYSLIDNNKTAKDLWDALARHMLGSEYGEQDRKAAVLYEYETFKATEGELLVDTYIRYLQVINDLKKCGYSKDNCELNFKFLNNLQPEWKHELKKLTTLLAKAFNRRKFYSKPTNNKLRTSSSSQSANKKQEFVKSDDKKVENKANEKKRDMSKVKCYNCKKEGHFAKDCKKAKTVHMIMPSKDNLYNGRKGIGFKNLSSFEKAKDLRPTLYDEKVTGLGYTPMFLTYSDEALEIEKFKRSRENKIVFAYDYGNLNASYQTSSLKPYVPNVILEEIIIDLEDEVVCSESENQSEIDCLVIEKECDKEENPKVIAHGMFKLNVSQCVSPISMSKSSCDSNNVEIKLKRKRRKRKSSKQNVKQVDNDVSHANSDFVHFLDLDTFSSVRRPKKSDVIWKKKGSSNTSNVGLSVVCVSNLNKNVKRYSRKDLLACNNSHLGETRNAFMCNDAMNVSCNYRMNDLLDDNNFLSLMITVHKWLPKLQPLAEPVAKWFPRIVQICLWIIDSGCSKHMTGNRIGNKMHKAFPLLVRKFPLLEGTSHCLKKNATARRKVLPLPERLLSVLIILEDPDLSFQQVVSELGKFKQWQFQMQQYLQHEYYPLWEVIEFEDSYTAPENSPSTTTTSTTSGDKLGRTVTLTTEDVQKKKNDVKDINQINEDDIEEMDIKRNMAILSMRADKFWKKTGKKISIQGLDVVGFDKSKVECFNYHKMGHFTRECRAPRNQERGRRDTYRQGSKAKEQTPKALMAIDGVGWD
nr:hypothetical protein [Tanacetum cinerariifolium]